MNKHTPAQVKTIRQLLKALEAIANNCDEDGTCFCEIGEGYHALSCPIIISKIARAAIAKATGK